MGGNVKSRFLYCSLALFPFLPSLWVCQILTSMKLTHFYCVAFTVLAGFKCSLESLGFIGWTNLSRSEGCSRPKHHTGAHRIFPLVHNYCTVEPFEESTPCQKLTVTNSLLLTTKRCPCILLCGNCQASN